MIKGELVNLRAVDRGDAADIYRWLNDAEVMRNWGQPSSTPSLTRVQGQIEEWLDGEATLGRPQCLIVEALESESIGFVQFGDFKPESRSTELSLLIGDPERWGQGFGADALETAIETCFDDWGMRRIWSRSEAFNERAQRLLARCGFVLEATLRDASYFEGSFHDVLIFGLLNTEINEE